MTKKSLGRFLSLILGEPEVFENRKCWYGKKCGQIVIYTIDDDSDKLKVCMPLTEEPPLSLDIEGLRKCIIKEGFYLWYNNGYLCLWRK